LVPPAGRFRHFAAAKSAGHGVFAAHMSRQKHPIEKVCDITDFFDKTKNKIFALYERFENFMQYIER